MIQEQKQEISNRVNSYILLAKSAVEAYVKEGKIITPPEGLPEEFFSKKAGAFVTIEKENNLRGLARSQSKLRGCIGTYLPTKESIAKEIIHNAIAAATEDYRFGPIQEQELPYLSYTVYILEKPELVKDLKELNPKKYGIVVKTAPIPPGLLHKALRAGVFPDKTDVIFNGYMPSKSGLLLPDLEGIDTAEKQISIACQKGGINPSQEKIIIYRFSVEKYQ